MKIGSLDLQQKISNQVAFLVILVFGLLVALVTINIGEKIISGFSKSELIKEQKNLNFSEEKTFFPK